jgi:hypothetical protein
MFTEGRELLRENEDGLVMVVNATFNNSVHKEVTEGRMVALLYPFATSLARG